MELGGIEKSLLGLFEALDYSKFDVDLFLFSHTGELLKFIPENIHLLPEMPGYAQLTQPLKQIVKRGHFLTALCRLFGKAAAKFALRRAGKTKASNIPIVYSHAFAVPFFKKINKNVRYDLLLSFSDAHSAGALKANAVKKAAFIHTDYSYISVAQKKESKILNRYDHIAAVSAAVAQNAAKALPSVAGKIEVVENCLPLSYISRQAQEFDAGEKMPKTKDCFNLLSIGRYSHPKNFDSVPEICREILRLGVNVKWYIIGYGPDETLIKSEILRCNAAENVILPGKTANPYPFIKACDVYVQPSRFEGKAVTVAEAQALCKPVVITNYSTAGCQLENGVDGIIVPIETKKCAAEIAKILKNTELLQRLSENCTKRNYGNFEQTKKIENFVEIS
jgi:glycosyltransferase involved in cell wall biosynthesis